jgi:predicted DsbA family dithiol-disulfide isomerase
MSRDVSYTRHVLDAYFDLNNTKNLGQFLRFFRAREKELREDIIEYLLNNVYRHKKVKIVNPMNSCLAASRLIGIAGMTSETIEWFFKFLFETAVQEGQDLRKLKGFWDTVRRANLNEERIREILEEVLARKEIQAMVMENKLLR